MKIGILTHHYINNFGAFLQTYAVQRAAEELFPDDDIYIIDYVNTKHFIVNTMGWWRFHRSRENLSGWMQKIRLPETFEKTRKKYLNMTSRVSSAKEINDLGFDTIVIGSDEVWNYGDKKSVDLIKFGEGLECKNIVVYAPSVGQVAGNSIIPDFVKEGIYNFSYLSARDNATYQLIKNSGRDAVRVLDPTFLVQFESEKIKVKKPYILFYYCENMPQKALNEIIEYAQKNGYALYGAGECGKIYNDITVNITPFQWIEMFRNASCVVTGTFHGVVFSILSKRQFVCYMSNPSRVAKVESLLEEFKLTDRKIDSGSVVELMDKHIDYEAVYEIVNTKAEISCNYLKESIENGRKKDCID